MLNSTYATNGMVVAPHHLAAKAGLDATLSLDIRLEIWRKFLLLTPMAGVSALTRVPAARIRETPAAWALVEPAMAEVVAVARAEGVGLEQADIERSLDTISNVMPPTWQASLSVDLQAGIDTPFHRIVLGALMPHAGGAP